MPTSNAERRLFEAAAARLRDGDIVAVPTETSYGLAVDPQNPSALEKLRVLKGGRDGKSFPLLIADITAAKKLVRFEARAEKLMQRFWPGALTLILPAMDSSHPCVGPDGTLGVRVSAHPQMQQLLSVWAGAVTGTSANLGGAAPAMTAAQVTQFFGDQVHIIDGAAGNTMPSTVVRVGSQLEIVRAGAISEKQLLEIWR